MALDPVCGMSVNTATAKQAAMSASSVSVVMNALRLRSARI
jgi:cation transport ATPase